MKIIDQKLNLNQTILLNKLSQLKQNSIELAKSSLQNQPFAQNQNITISNSFQNLLSELFANTTTDKVLFNIFKNIPILKTFEHFGSEAKKLIEIVEAKNLKNIDLAPLKSLLVDIQKLDEKTLQKMVERNILGGEAKAILSELIHHSGNEEIQNQANKMIAQIEYFQLSSYLNHSIHSYLPFDWDDFKDGDIEFKKEEDEQFVCHINLELHSYGKLKINILYNSNHLSLGFFIENERLKEIISEELPQLRYTLKENNFMVQNISLIDLKELEDERVNSFKEDGLSYNSLELRV